MGLLLVELLISFLLWTGAKLQGMELLPAAILARDPQRSELHVDLLSPSRDLLV